MQVDCDTFSPLRFLQRGCCSGSGVPGSDGEETETGVPPAGAGVREEAVHYQPPASSRSMSRCHGNHQTLHECEF